jgi:hypothetical protein
MRCPILGAGEKAVRPGYIVSGELRLAERLKDFLEENAVVWHNLPVGPRGRHPDFIIVHPANGLLVLEVKDWRLESIASADKTKVELLTSRGTVRERNPLEQARKYAFEVVHTLERDGQLLFPADHRFKGRPILPFGFGAVFTNITRKQFDQTNLKEVLAENLCVSRMRCRRARAPKHSGQDYGAWFIRVSESLCRCRSSTGCVRYSFPKSAYDKLPCLWTNR